MGEPVQLVPGLQEYVMLPLPVPEIADAAIVVPCDLSRRSTRWVVLSTVNSAGNVMLHEEDRLPEYMTFGSSCR